MWERERESGDRLHWIKRKALIYAWMPRSFFPRSFVSCSFTNVCRQIRYDMYVIVSGNLRGQARERDVCTRVESSESHLDIRISTPLFIQLNIRRIKKPKPSDFIIKINREWSPLLVINLIN